MKKNLNSLFVILSISLLSIPSFASDQLISSSNDGIFAISGAIVMAMCAVAGTYNQGKVASSALEGIARNPGASGKVFVPMILSLALIESLVIFGLLISFIILGKIS